MELTLIMKAAGIGLIVSFICQILVRSGRDEQAMLLSIAGIIIVLTLLIDRLSDLITAIKRVFGI